MAIDTSLQLFHFPAMCRDSRGNASITVTAPADSGCQLLLMMFDPVMRHPLIDNARVGAGGSFVFTGLADGVAYRVEARSLDGNANTSSEKVTATNAGTNHTVSFLSGSSGGSSGGIMSGLSMTS